MALERTYIIPLRREWLKTPRHKRAKKAVKAVKEFIEKHMKSDNVKVGGHLNLKIWERGIKNPPHKVKVTAIKEDDGMVKVELFGKKYVVKKKIEKKETPTGIAGKLQSALGTGKEDKKEAEQEEEKEEAKEEKKPEKKQEKPAEKKKPAKPAKKQEKKAEKTKPAKKPAAKPKK
ncbi:50S ribosomal protein L31e [Thermoproteota archaeon]